MIDKVLERITLTKEDIKGMINDVVKEKRSSSKPTNPFGSLEDFKNFIIKTYAPGQTIIGLDNFYNSVVNNSRYQELILNPPAKSLKTGTYPIVGTEKELYEIIDEDIKIPNGHPSELWFAIVFKGLVVGAQGKTPDVEVGNQTVSLKNYTTATFDFGTVDTQSKKILDSLVRLSFLLTESPIDPGQKSRGDINRTLETFESNELKKQVKEILELGETTTIPSIKKISGELESLINSDNPNDLHNLSVKLCSNINEILKRKIFAANWWGLIITGNATLFLESADDVYKHIKCVNNRLSNAIAHFKADHLWINGSQLSTKVNTKKEKS